MTRREINETVTIRVGVIGMTEEGMGTASLRLHSDMTDTTISSMVQSAFTTATMSAMNDFAGRFNDYLLERAKGAN